MNSFRNATIIALFAASFTVPVSFAQQGAGEVERKVDQIFAAYDKPNSPGCALGVVRDGELVYKKRSQRKQPGIACATHA